MSGQSIDCAAQLAAHRRHRTLYLVYGLVGCTVFAFVLAGVAARYAYSSYLDRAALKLDPAGSGRYAAENAVLARKQTRRMVFFGDSRVALWNPKPPISGVQLVFRGIAGQTTSQMRFRFVGDVLELKPETVVIQAGINDLVSALAIGRQHGASERAFRNLEAMVRQATDAGCTVLLTTVVRPATPPIWRRPVWSDAIYELVDELNVKMRTLQGLSVRVLDIDRTLSENDKPLGAPYALDTLHFTPDAYRAINDQLLIALRAH